MSMARVHYDLLEVTEEDVHRQLVRIGHPLDERTFALAWTAASRFIGTRRGYRDNIGAVGEALAGMVMTPAAADLGGQPLLANLRPTRWPYPEVDGGTKAWSVGKHALDRLGLEPTFVDDLWSDAVVRDGAHATLPLGLVCAFFPPPLLAAIGAVIAAGVVDATRLLERFLLVKSRTVAQTGARRGQRVSFERLRTIEESFRAFALVLSKEMYVNFRFPEEDPRKPPESALAGWFAKPPRLDLSVFKAPPARTDRSAPEHLELRRALARVNGRIPARLTTEVPLEAFTEALAIELSVAIGPRVGALARLRPRDFVEHHPAFDGPAVLVRPMKDLDADEVRAKPIRRELFDLARRYFEWAGIISMPDRVIWVSGWQHERVGNPLPPPSHNAVKLQISHAIKRVLHGKSSHTIRHAIDQYAAAATKIYLETHRSADPRLGRISERVGADALLDHAWGEADRHGYGDLERDREKFALIAARGVRRFLHEVDGQRMAPDWPRIARAQKQRDAQRAALRDCEQRLDRLTALRRELELEGDSADAAEVPSVNNDGDLRAMIQLLLEELRRERENSAEERRRRRELTRLTHQRDDLLAYRTLLTDSLRDADAELRAASEARVPVPDELTDEEYVSLCAGVPAIDAVEEPAEAAGELLREWVTPAELARASGRSPATIRNYLAGRSPCPWWESDQRLEIVERASKRTQRIWVNRISAHRVAPIMWDRLQTLCGTPPPSWYGAASE